jgi:ABC-2 type transport system permease protein
VTDTLHAARTLARRNVLLLANPRFVSMTFVVPLVFFAGFAAVLHRLTQPVVNFGMFFPPAIVVQIAMDSAISTAFFLAGDCRDGIVTRLRSMPISALAFPMARLGVDAARFAVSATVVLCAGVVIGFRFEGGAPAALGFAALAIWFALALSALTSGIGLRSDDPETVSSNLYLPYLPLLTLSTAFVPISAFPGAAAPIVRNSPVSAEVEALRGLSAGDLTGATLGRAIGWLAVLSVVGAVAVVTAYRRRRTR